MSDERPEPAEAQRLASPVWRKPPGPYLLGERFPSGKPPFDPFPTVSLVMKGYCSVAIYHDLVWGRSWDGKSDAGIGQAIGPLYHDFIATFRWRIALGLEGIDSSTDATLFQAKLQRFFNSWVDRRNLPVAARNALWSSVSKLFTRKLSEVVALAGKKIFEEVDIVNHRTEFNLPEGTRRFPIRGRIDELNLSDGVLVERTLENDPLTNEPPPYKRFQAWLCAKAITTLPPMVRPNSLQGIWTRPLKVLLETPEKDIWIDPNTREFEPWVSQAFYWIRALYRNQGQAASYAYERASCSAEHPDESCSHCRIDCFVKKYSFPERRRELSRICATYARALLYDRMWDSDLWYYQQSYLPQEFHQDTGDRLEGAIESVDQQVVTVKLEAGGGSSLEPGTPLTAIPGAMGNFYLGKRLRMSIADRRIVGSDTLLSVKLGKYQPPLAPGDRITLFVDRGDRMVVLQEPLGHLKDLVRSRLARFRRIGTDSLLQAEQSGLTQLLRAITGEALFERV
jgi:hypothetical protein